MKTLIFAAFAILSFAHPTFAADKKIQCVAKGPTLSRMGGTLLNAEAQFSFDESLNRRGLRTISNIEGSVKTIQFYGTEETNYLGTFKIAALSENPNYRPHRYQNYSQYKNFDATDTTGSFESGMWGTLVVEKSTDGSPFQAHYIFQAGDHMGGTLHLSCNSSTL